MLEDTEASSVIHRAWLAHGGPLWHYVTTLEPDGRLSVARSERIDRR